MENGKSKNVHLIILNQKGMKLEKEKRNELLSCRSTWGATTVQRPTGKTFRKGPVLSASKGVMWGVKD